MVPRDLANNIGIAVSLPPATYAAPTNGDTVDVAGFDSCAFVVANSDAGGVGDLVTVEEAADDGTGNPGAFAPVAAEDLDGAFVALAGEETQKVGYLGRERFVRLVTDADSGDAECVGLVVLGSPQTAPVA